MRLYTAILALAPLMLGPLVVTAHAGDRYVHRVHDGHHSQRAYDAYREQQLGYGGHVHPRHHEGRQWRGGVSVGMELYGHGSRAAPTFAEPYHRPRYVEGHAPRTRFCRHEYRRSGHSQRKVRVKRCILVRDDLLGVHAAEGWTRY